MKNVVLARALSLNRKLQKLPSGVERLTLVFIFLFFPCAIFALKLFPNGDGFYSYILHYHYAISSLLNGEIPLWDPMAACGSPNYLSFISAGLLEPLFAVSIFAGKIFSLNVFQIYMTCLVLRSLPFLIGMFWLIKQYCRHSVLALLGATFSYYTFAISLLHDGITYAIYWPLLLAVLTHFFRSLKSPSLSTSAFYGAILFLSLSLLAGNPAFTLFFVGIFGTCRFFVSGRNSIYLLKLIFQRIGIKHWVAGGLLALALLSPILVISQHYLRGEHFALLRVHHAYAGSGRTVSQFLDEPLDYMEVSVKNPPMRRAKMLGTVFFPFLHNIIGSSDGTLYFGYLGLLGVIVGIIFLRTQAFLTFLFASLFTVFAMTWSANELHILLGALFSPLKIMNQRQLLFPAFIIFATMAGCLGFRALLDFRFLRKISPQLTFSRSLLASIVFMTAGILYVFITSDGMVGRWIWAGTITAQYVLFVSVTTLIALLARGASQRPKFICVYLTVLFLVYVVDANCCYRFLIRKDNRNSGIFAQSLSLRNETNLKYVPFRSPQLPSIYWHEPVLSIVHQFNLRSAFPSYWDCDLLFTSKRYYDVISRIDPGKLRHIVSIASPIIRIYPKNISVSQSEDSLTLLDKLSESEAGDTVVIESSVQKSPLPRQAFYDWVLKKPLRGGGYAASNPDEFMESSRLLLFDHMVTVPKGIFEETPQGAYRKRVFRIRFPDNLKYGYKDRQDMLSRYFFPEFPYAIDINGEAYYASLDNQTMLKFISNEGLLVESSAEALTLPDRFLGLNERQAPSQNVNVVSMSPNRVVIDAETKEKAVLSFSDIFDSNWRATLDGRPADIMIANHAFKAVWLPVGKHRVIFQYVVPYLMAALILYFLCLFSVISIFVYTNAKKKVYSFKI